MLKTAYSYYPGVIGKEFSIVIQFNAFLTLRNDQLLRITGKKGMRVFRWRSIKYYSMRSLAADE